MLYVQDPKTNEKSVSLTLLWISFVVLLVVGVAEVIGKVESTGPFTELFYSTLALYFGRRINFNTKFLSSNIDGEGSKNEKTNDSSAAS